MKQTLNIQSDVQSETNQTLAGLSWVGMGQIQSSVKVAAFNVPCLLDLGVNLKPGHRGIHMSRLYQAHQDYFLNQNLNSEQLQTFLDQALISQGQLSESIALKIHFQFPVQTKSLKSGLLGFRNYPVQIIVQKNTNEKIKIWVQFEVLYSSTCPQSAGLSVEVLKSSDVVLDRLPATPHAQRSRAVVKVLLNNFESTDVIENLIAHSEMALKTPVQTAVKKADEMEFAKLNAANLMFCEDAARILAGAYLKQNHVMGFSVFCEHQESLHPHNASSLLMHNYSAPNSINFS